MVTPGFRASIALSSDRLLRIGFPLQKTSPPTLVGGLEAGGGRRHLGKKALVVIAAEVRGRAIGRIRMQRVADASADSLLSFVQHAVHPGSVVITDGLQSYRRLPKLGYRHDRRVLLGRGESAEAVLPRVHRVASLSTDPADSWLDRSTSDRCLLGFNAGPPLNPVGYNQNLQIFQTPDYVVLLTEMVHTARVVPLDERPPVDDAIRQWSGDARGHWEGDTLVVETSNFNSERRWRSSSAGAQTDPEGLDSVVGVYYSTKNLTLVERFTRVDAATLDYEYTVTDPETWTRPWTASIPLQRTDVPMYEYACHEGNLSMYGILGGRRADEKAAAARP